MMRRLILSVVLAAVGVPAVSQTEPDFTPPETEAACLDAGGRWALGGLSGRPLCFLPTPDAGQACTTGADCTGFCLAETRTCTEVTPYFGCFGMIDLDGYEATLCVD